MKTLETQPRRTATTGRKRGWALGAVAALAVLGLVLVARGLSASGSLAGSDPAAPAEAGSRDAERLALAQAWHDAGRFEEARAILAELAARGSTPSIRARAGDILAQLPP